MSAPESTSESPDETSKNHREIRPTPWCTMEQLEEYRLIVDGTSGGLCLCSMILLISVLAVSCENIPIESATAEWLLDRIVLVGIPIGIGLLFVLPTQFVLAIYYVIRQLDERIWSDNPAEMVTDSLHDTAKEVENHESKGN